MIKQKFNKEVDVIEKTEIDKNSKIEKLFMKSKDKLILTKILKYIDKK